MAYMSQEKKSKINAVIKPILKNYGLKGSLSVNNHSTLVLTIKAGSIDFLGNYKDKINLSLSRKPFHGFHEEKYIQVNQYYLADQFSGRALEVMEKLKTTMFAGNHDNSDAMIDHFDVGWYVSINVGKWDKPYINTLDNL